MYEGSGTKAQGIGDNEISGSRSSKGICCDFSTVQNHCSARIGNAYSAVSNTCLNDVDWRIRCLVVQGHIIIGNHGNVDSGISGLLPVRAIRIPKIVLTPTPYEIQWLATLYESERIANVGETVNGTPECDCATERNRRSVHHTPHKDNISTNN